jgi:chaperonin cofactor prefoldin
MNEKSTQEMHQNIGALEMRMRALEDLVAALKSELDRLNQQLTSLSRL